MGGGGGRTPFFLMEKCVLSHFFPWEKWGKKCMEREGNEYFSLSFHILFSHFSPWGKMGKHTFFLGQKWGWTPPPQFMGIYNSFARRRKKDRAVIWITYFDKHRSYCAILFTTPREWIINSHKLGRCMFLMKSNCNKNL